MYVVPNDVKQKFNYMEYTFDVIVADIMERSLLNQTDILSDTNQILDDIISQFRLSVTQSLGNFNAEYYLDNPIVCTPFMEQYDDLLGGWTATLTIQVMTPLNRCDAAFFDTFVTPTPTVTSTNTSTPTPTPSITPTNTLTPTNTNTPTPTNTETPTQTPTVTQTETPTNTPTPSVTTSMTPTQTQSQTPTNTPTVTQTPTPSNVFYYYNIELCSGGVGLYNKIRSLTTISIGSSVKLAALPTCYVVTSLSDSSGVAINNWNLYANCDECLGITPTPTPTTTTTQTPSVTPTRAGGNKLWNTNTTNWDSETGLWNTV
jgi:hypothetical protein